MFGKFDAPAAFSLDPFAFWPGTSSRIDGLGGGNPPPQLDVVFHTAYTSFEPGPLTVDLVFMELAAAQGRMTVHALALADSGLGAPKVQTTATVDLATLAAEGGRYRLPMICKAGHLYAFMARMLDHDAAAKASGLTVSASQHADGATFMRRLAAARAAMSQPRSDPSGLIVESSATLAAPLSQMCTAAQFDEPDYRRWIDLMGRPLHRHRKQWEHVWIGRTLEAMGGLAEGVRGLGFGCGIEPLPAVFAAHGAMVTATDLGAQDRRARRWQATAQHLLSVEALADPAVCALDLFAERVAVRAVDMNDVPDDLVDYDFCWSSCSLEHLGTIDAGLAFIERSLATLKPGGLALHTTELNLTSDTSTMRRGGTVLFRRRDIEAFARRMIRAGHEVLPITFDQGDQPEDLIVDVAPFASDWHFKLALGRYVSTSFGLAIRKAR